MFDPTVAIVFGTLFLSLIASLIYAFWYQQFKHSAKRGRSDDQSLTASELKGLIREAVDEATSTASQK